MKALFGVVGAVIAIAIKGNVASAAPRKILVLPLDGNVDRATRAQLNGSVLRMANQLPGTVTVADTTFDETAAAVGCDPAKPACAEAVRSTLAVDELVFGRATSAATTTLVVRRVRADGAPLTVTTTIGIDDTDEVTDDAIAPAFAMTAAAPSLPSERPHPPSTTPAPPLDAPPRAAMLPNPPSPSSRARTRGILLTVGGSAVMVAGLVLWISVASDQGDLDAADPETADDFVALRATEDRVQRNAILGDVFVLAGVGLTTWGVVILYRDHEAHREITLAPKVSSTSAGLALQGRW